MSGAGPGPVARRSSLAAALIAVAGMLAACVPGAGAPASAMPPVSASPYPSAYQAAAYQLDRLHVAVPSGWSIRPANVSMHYVTVVAYLGTAPSRAGCRSVPPPPGALSATECSSELNLAPGTVTIELDQLDGPPHVSPLDFETHLEPGAQLVTVDGMPGVLTVNGPSSRIQSADQVASLLLPVPSQVNGRYLLTGYVRGPGADALLAQVEHVLRGVRYEPPVAPLPTDAASRARVVATALDALAATDSLAYACFPRVPGASVGTTISRLPGTDSASEPIPATCSTELRALPDALWELDLTASWGQPGASPTIGRTSDYLLPDGTPTWVSGMSANLP